MELDYARQEEKVNEVLLNIEQHLKSSGFNGSNLTEQSKLFLNIGINITAPEKEQFNMQFITMSPSGRGGGKSTKAGNITLNIKSLMEAVSSGVFTIVSVTQTPWAIPFAAILVWNSLWKNIQVELSEAEAITLWVMWEVKDSKNNVQVENIKPAIDEHAKKYDITTLSQGDIEYSIKNLKEIGCIKPTRNMSGDWWLCEWIKPSYQ